MSNKELIRAIIKGDGYEKVEKLIKSSVLYINDQHFKGTPLEVALEYFKNDPSVIISLIKKGADVNCRSCFEKALYLLPKLQCDRRMELLSLFLAHGADPNKGSQFSILHPILPIHTLTLQDSVEGVKLLLQAKAGVNILFNDRKDYTKSCLHIAVEKQNLEMVKLLIDWKADIDAIMIGCWTLYEYDPLQHKHSIFETALHIAIRKKSKDIVKYLVICGANPFIEKKEYWDDTLKESLENSWELCGNDEELKLLLDFNFLTPKDYQFLSSHLKITLKVFLLCNLRNNWKLPKDILFKIFSYSLKKYLK